MSVSRAPSCETRQRQGTATRRSVRVFPSDYGGMAWMSGLGDHRRLLRQAGSATIGRKKSPAMGIDEGGMPVAISPFIFASFAW